MTIIMLHTHEILTIFFIYTGVLKLMSAVQIIVVIRSMVIIISL